MQNVSRGSMENDKTIYLHVEWCIL